MPGIIMLRTLWGSSRGSIHQKNIYSYLIWGTLFSVLIYTPLILLINGICSIWTSDGLKIKCIYEYIFKIQKIPLNFSDARWLLLFCIVVNFLVFGLSLWLNRQINLRWLDIKWRFLKFESDWFYILSGRMHFFANRNDKKISHRLVIADIVADVGGQTVIYSGFVADYKLKSGLLDHIKLNVATRRPFNYSSTEIATHNNSIVLTKKSTDYVSLKSFGTIETSASIKLDGALENFGEIKAGGSIDVKGSIKTTGSIKACSITVTRNEAPKEDIEAKAQLLANSNPDIYVIPGDLLVIKMNEIKNANFRYIEVRTPTKYLSI
jgi:hypothetical protein